MRIHPELVDQQGSDEQNRGGKSERDDMGDFVAVTQPLNKRTRPRLGRDRVSNRGGRCGHLLDQRNGLQFLCDNGLRQPRVRQTFIVF